MRNFKNLNGLLNFRISISIEVLESVIGSLHVIKSSVCLFSGSPSHAPEIKSIGSPIPENKANAFTTQSTRDFLFRNQIVENDLIAKIERQGADALRTPSRLALCFRLLASRAK